MVGEDANFDSVITTDEGVETLLGGEPPAVDGLVRILGVVIVTTVVSVVAAGGTTTLLGEGLFWLDKLVGVVADDDDDVVVVVCVTAVSADRLVGSRSSVAGVGDEECVTATGEDVVLVCVRLVPVAVDRTVRIPGAMAHSYS